MPTIHFGILKGFKQPDRHNYLYLSNAFAKTETIIIPAVQDGVYLETVHFHLAAELGSVEKCYLPFKLIPNHINFYDR